MPLARLHCDALDGVDTATVVTVLAAPTARDCIVAEFPPPPEIPCPKPDFAEPCAHLLREVTA